MTCLFDKRGSSDTNKQSTDSFVSGYSIKRRMTVSGDDDLPFDEEDSFTMQDVLVGMIKVLLKDRDKPEWRRLINA